MLARNYLIRYFLIAALLHTVVLQSGCATLAPAYYAEEHDNSLTPVEDYRFSHGRDLAPLDTLGNIISIPNKLLLWDKTIENHHITPATEHILKAYLDDHGLYDVKVRVNQYAPLGELQRLINNEQVGIGWRVTIGALSVLYYTLFVGRIFGGDSYNPFTNTISLYSDSIPIALHEGGHASDFASKKYKGTYAFINAIPFTSLYFEGVATNNVLEFLNENNAYEEYKRAYEVLFPAYGTYVGGSLIDLRLSYGPGASDQVLYLAPVLIGHIVGRIKSSRLRREEHKQVSPINSEQNIPATNSQEIECCVEGAIR
ncbi:MAG TPA: hypothetical protein DCZ03_00520 [Gammaproteobacteria bacterium]|nr:hypothetical protein [Gammaproteobacteria bacterium]